MALLTVGKEVAAWGRAGFVSGGTLKIVAFAKLQTNDAEEIALECGVRRTRLHSGNTRTLGLK